ncbi:MAG: regulatory iron-sulfur-containing complex subunit RicT [Thermodesulfobacteriota bacterium]|nr:regulatory iron-sulfur-containing complex subunit RicT [Thermodesulfobacteriota bacterium]
MNKIVGIQLGNRGKVYDFDSEHFVLKKEDRVIVMTEDGPAVGCVRTMPKKRLEDIPSQHLKKISHLATPDEIDKYKKCCKLEQDVYQYCHERIKEKSVPMSLVSVERRFDGSKIVLYFTAEGRVDFRELVKDLGGKFKVRIEMRQIGVRHQAKMVEGIGVCGRPMCCAAFLNTFAPVTIKMAKEQNITLNPAKISGMCGRLMCCLTYEHEHYAKIKKDLPGIGKKVITRDGAGKVIRQNILKQSMTVMLESGTEIEVRSRDLIREGLFKKKQKRE